MDDWRTEAACRGMDTDAFFPTRGDSATYRTAVAICRTCSVADECLEYAVSEGIRYGIFGGLSEKQRRRIKRVAECGTVAGYKRHHDHGEPGCDACRAANAAYKRRRIAS